MQELSIDSVLGCLLGGAIGDAAGAAYEGMREVPPTPTRDSTNWRLTDDTQLTLATCEALTPTPDPDPEAIAASLLRWFRARRLTGLGASTLKALLDLDAGVHWALAGRKGERAAGNGAAMRIAPLAFCVDPREEAGRRMIRDVSRITHHSDEAYTGALAVALAIGEGLHGAFEGGHALRHIASALPPTSVRERLTIYADLPLTMPLGEVGRRHGTSGYVVESVPFALLAATRVGELGYAGMLDQVIAAGGDTDTNASLAGQVSGTVLRLQGLPAELRERLPQADLVFETARAFVVGVAGQANRV